MDRPDYSSGQYTIDPNMGSTKDALKSYCDFKSSIIKTCVHVSISKIIILTSTFILSFALYHYIVYCIFNVIFYICIE